MKCEIQLENCNGNGRMVTRGIHYCEPCRVSLWEMQRARKPAPMAERVRSGASVANGQK